MASILRVNTLTDASSNNSVATSVVFNGTAKAWVHFDQTDQSMYDNYNIGSITDKAVGETTFTFTSNMSAANWSASFYANASGSSGDSQFGAGMSGNIGLRTATGFIFEGYNGSSMIDSKHCDTQVFGDLA